VYVATMSFEGSMYKLTLAFLLVSSISLSYADTVTLTFNSLPTTNEDGSYSTSASDATYNGYVPTTINGTFSGLLICDDSAHNTDVPSGPDVYYISTLANPAPFADGTSAVRFTSSNTILNITGIEEYEAAAVLLTQLAAFSNPSANTITDYQYALWNIFTPGNEPINETQQTLDTAAVALVQAGAISTQADYSNLVIYTPSVGFTNNQEFLALTATAPEPASWALMALLTLLLAVPQMRSRVYAVIRSRRQSK
jgi:hypothetical protein